MKKGSVKWKVLGLGHFPECSGPRLRGGCWKASRAAPLPGYPSCPEQSRQLFGIFCQLRLLQWQQNRPEARNTSPGRCLTRSPSAVKQGSFAVRSLRFILFPLAGVQIATAGDGRRGWGGWEKKRP